jgi:CPA2 family monovalent cation:H+ antiporter-2
MEELILREIAVLFLLSIVVVLVCHRFRLPSIVGFLLTGVLCGPSALGLIPNKEAVDIMAEVGVAFLMFTIGMELSGKELVRMKRPLLLGGTAQVVLTMAAVFGLTFWWSGMRLGLVYGCMVTLSSTAIVLSLLQQKGQMDSPQGRTCLAVLIFQDLAIVPMVLMLPLLSGGLAVDIHSMAFAAGKGVLTILGILHEYRATTRICGTIGCCETLYRIALQQEQLFFHSKLSLSCHGIAKNTLRATF